MSHQDGLGDNRPETTGLSKPDDGDDRMEKKSENVAHTRDGIKLKNVKNSGRLRNSPPTGVHASLNSNANVEMIDVRVSNFRMAAPHDRLQGLRRDLLRIPVSIPVVPERP